MKKIAFLLCNLLSVSALAGPVHGKDCRDYGRSDSDSSESDSDLTFWALNVDDSLEAQVLFEVAQKAFGKKYYADSIYAHRLFQQDLKFLRMLIDDPESQGMLPPFSYWLDVLDELEKRQKDKK